MHFHRFFSSITWGFTPIIHKIEQSGVGTVGTPTTDCETSRWHIIYRFNTCMFIEKNFSEHNPMRKKIDNDRTGFSWGSSKLLWRALLVYQLTTCKPILGIINISHSVDTSFIKWSSCFQVIFRTSLVFLFFIKQFVFSSSSWHWSVCEPAMSIFLTGKHFVLVFLILSTQWEAKYLGYLRMWKSTVFCTLLKKKHSKLVVLCQKAKREILESWISMNSEDSLRLL